MTPVIVIERHWICLLTPHEQDYDKFITFINRDHRCPPHIISLDVRSADALQTEWSLDSRPYIQLMQSPSGSSPRIEQMSANTNECRQHWSFLSMGCIVFADIMSCRLADASMRDVDWNHVVLAAARKPGIALLQEQDANKSEIAMQAATTVSINKITVLLISLARKYQTCHRCSRFSVHDSYQGLWVNLARC